VSQSQRQLREAWGQFLAQFPWDWFVSLSFREMVPTFRAHRLVRYFLSDIEKAAGVPIFWFRTDEYGEHTGRFHIHVLVGNVAHLRRLDWMDEWNRRAGYARIVPFDQTRGAAYYCAKYVTKQSGDWELSDNVLAFHQYQPALPLSGPTKDRSVEINGELVSGQQNVTAPPRKQPTAVQYPIAPAFTGYPHRPTIGIMDVYRAEVTRGKGRFREFFG